MVEVSPQCWGIKLPEPLAMSAAVVLSNSVDEQVLAWHRGVFSGLGWLVGNEEPLAVVPCSPLQGIQLGWRTKWLRARMGPVVRRTSSLDPTRCAARTNN
jgi:hypothetical protein